MVGPSWVACPGADAVPCGAEAAPGQGQVAWPSVDVSAQVQEADRVTEDDPYRQMTEEAKRVVFPRSGARFQEVPRGFHLHFGMGCVILA